MKKFDFIKSDQKNKCFETTSKLAHSIGVENISKQYFYEMDSQIRSIYLLFFNMKSTEDNFSIM